MDRESEDITRLDILLYLQGRKSGRLMHAVRLRCETREKTFESERDRETRGESAQERVVVAEFVRRGGLDVCGLRHDIREAVAQPPQPRVAYLTNFV